MAGENEHVVDILLEVLDDERARLRRGAIDGMEETAQRKETLVAELAATPDASPEKIAAARLALDRNAALLLAAAEGIGRVKDRISDIREGEKGLGTYGADGSRAEIGPRRSKFQGKA